MVHWQSTVLRAAAANRNSESDRWPKDYRDFEATLLTMLLVLASQALTDRTRRFDLFFIPDRPIFGAGAAGAAGATGAVFRDTGTAHSCGSVTFHKVEGSAPPSPMGGEHSGTGTEGLL